MKNLIFNILALVFVFSNSFGQRKIVNLPDLPGYVTLKCDFHMHTVFSDGNVWPTVRIDEALHDGLDAIAKDSVLDAVEEAVKQGAFIQWNHPGWKAQQPEVKAPLVYDVRNVMIGENDVLKIELKY